MKTTRTIFISAVLIITVSACDDPDDVPAEHISAPVTPVATKSDAEVERHPQRIALYGDLHVHTSWSVDAYAGNNRLGPNGAYEFARGERVELPTGEAQLKTPLDFVAITDHAEGFTTQMVCTTPGAPEFDLPQCRSSRAGEMDQQELLKVAFERGLTRPATRDPNLCKDEAHCLENARAAWQLVQDTANAYNDPGKFTTLIGYEFSSLLPDYGMLHRNVIFRGSDVIPHAISAQDVANQREFFSELDANCEEPCRVLTIPHNTNFSWGVTFTRTDEDGAAYTAEDLERRTRIDRLFEITQQKGASECTLGVGATDEDCDFGNLFPACEDDQHTRCIKPQSMYRDVLLDGLALGEEQNINPNKLGAIGSTDTHQSDPGNTRSIIPSSFAQAEGWSFFTNRILETDHVVVGHVRKFLMGGLAAVWAEANTRADVFDALQRREAFATSGSRLQIRFFGGDLPAELSSEADPVATAYTRGVPMGSDLPATTSPTFWVWAAQDPLEASLDRIQVVKGWIEDGETHQKLWDVACSGGREPHANGKCPATPASVDITTCEVDDASGAAELQATFSDPDFSRETPAFYYVRVFENPTCHWTTHFANAADVDLPTDIPPVTQQRGWSSPIWVGSPE